MSAAPALKPKLKYRLKIIAGPHQNEIHSLDKDLIKIGRGDENTIQLPRDGRISRNHVEIIWTGSEFKLKNLSQKNFVMINDKIIQDEALKPGAKIQIGETLIEVFEDGPILVANSPATVIATSPAPAALTPAAVKPSANLRVAPVPKSAEAKAAPRPQPKKPAPKAYNPQSGSRTKFYLIVAAVIGGIVWLATQDVEKKEKNTFRTSQQVEYDRLQAEAERLKIEERWQNQNNQLTKQAQENLVKGFRDFQQGNYARARDNFGSVLIKDPNNELANRYYRLSITKFDELLQFNILQGLRYREKKNYRLCRSSFQSALIMIQNNNRHPKYKEIKGYFDECNMALEDRF